ncbi:MAG: AMP-binding protein [Gammaproteobacteria bacterium]|nr:AMP-binding protein [Gammaproteobacteria bacterium]
MSRALDVLRLIVREIVRALYRIRVVGLENYHRAGDRVLIVANHVSLLDGVLLYLFVPDRPTFAINTLMAKKWQFRPFLAFVDLFPLDPTSPLSTKSLIRFLREDRKAIIFPEGRITVTGSLMKIYEGPGMVADRAAAMVLPIGIEGAQYSPLSYLRGRVRIRWFPRITLRFLEPVRIDLPDDLQGHERRKAAAERLAAIMRRISFENCNHRTTLFTALLDAMDRHGPGQPLLEDVERRPLSYRQLIMRAFLLAGVIRQASKRGEHVGILLPNSIAAVVTLFAMQACGRVPAMLNFTSGAQMLVTACETARIATVYTSRRFVDVAGLQGAVQALASRVDVIYLEDLRNTIGLFSKLLALLAARLPRLACALTHPQGSPDDTSVVLFTSGSEGIPKGVILTHANLLANRAQMQMLIDLTLRDTVFNCMPVFHSFGLTGGVILPILDGARIFLYPSPLHYRIIPELAYELGATVLFGTNTFLAGYARYAHPYDFYSMRFVVAGAEKLQEDTRRSWADRFGIRIFEGYGTTETSPVLAVNTPMGNNPGTVGRLLTGIDHYLEPVPGIERGGRLVVHGPNVMKGYLFHGHDDITRPWTERRGVGWYDTGDVVEVDADGYVTIIGRAKRFAKIGGEMVSLTTVEELAAAAWPDSTHAALALEDDRRGEQIVLVTCHPFAERRDLVDAARLNGYSELTVPRRIHVVDEIPVLGTGKIDYRAVADRIRRETAERPS